MSPPDDDDLLSLIRRVARREGLGGPANADAGPEPSSLGRYRLSRRIGAGGMGIVYEAEQQSPRRRVALKVLHPQLLSESASLRFAHEAEVLGRLDHVGIARIFEAGTFDLGQGAQPFFAMELVRGENLADWAKQGDPSVSRRLTTFVAICDAVQHAHTQGVIHRDLKPANILVTEEGQPKILDFGVARSVDVPAAGLTRAGQMLGTLEYMSPEQVLGDPLAIDTRTDVHALGMLLFELLTGEQPYRTEGASPAAIVRTLTEDEPRRLGDVDPRLRGDLEVIAGKALAKVKELRYVSAAALAGDIHRFLAHEPVEARAPSAVYKLARFARRNRLLVGLLGAVVAVLLGGIFTTARQAARAHRAELEALDSAAEALRRQSVAEEEARKAREISGFLEKLLVQADPERSDTADIRFREVLDRASGWVEAGELGEPDVEAAVRFALGSAYFGLGAVDAARDHLEAARVIRERQGDDTDHPTLLEVLALLGRAALVRGELDAAEAIARRTLAARRASVSPDSLDWARAVANLGMVLLNRGRAEEAQARLREALRIVQAAPGEHEEEAVLLAKLGEAERLRGRLDEAERLIRESIDVSEDLHGEDSVAVAHRLRELASLLLQRGRAPAAERHLLRSLRNLRARYDGSSLWVADAVRELALIRLDRGQLDSAAELLEQALASYRAGAGRETATVASTLEKLALVRRAQERFGEAEALYREALRIGRASVGKGHPDTLVTTASLGRILIETGRAREAEPLLAECLALARRTFADDHPRVATVRVDYGRCLAILGREEEALVELRAALASLRSSLGDAHPSTRYAATELARVAD